MAMDEIVTIDCHYLDQPEFAAAYLLVDGDEAAFIDNNTNRAVPHLLAALADRGLRPDQVRYLIITHVHLDHAGATATLAGHCPNATVIAHPRAARHVIDPGKLVAGASEVYGESEFARLYGAIEPVHESRVRSMDDDATLDLGTRRLRFLHTRGHANHHFCIVDESSSSVFTGDAFGLHYPALQKSGTFAFPSTSPSDFDAPLARESIARLAELGMTRMFPTHFGEVTAIHEAAEQLVRQLDFAEELMLEAEESEVSDDKLQGYVEPRLRRYFGDLLAAENAPGAHAWVWDLVDLDINLNAQGIAYAAAKRRRKARERAE